MYECASSLGHLVWAWFSLSLVIDILKMYVNIAMSWFVSRFRLAFTALAKPIGLVSIVDWLCLIHFSLLSVSFSI